MTQPLPHVDYAAVSSSIRSALKNSKDKRSMSNHPVFQPRLNKSNVETTLRYINTEIDRVGTPPPSKPSYTLDDLIAARNEGLLKAAEILRAMWFAAEIAAEAANKERERLHDEGEVPDEVP